MRITDEHTLVPTWNDKNRAQRVKLLRCLVPGAETTIYNPVKRIPKCGETRCRGEKMGATQCIGDVCATSGTAPTEFAYEYGMPAEHTPRECRVDGRHIVMACIVMAYTSMAASAAWMAGISLWPV